MPREIQLRDGFKVVEGHASCPVDRPWGVARADGSLHPDCGCHPTMKAALKHMAEFFESEKGLSRMTLKDAEMHLTLVELEDESVH